MIEKSKVEPEHFLFCFDETGSVSESSRAQYAALLKPEREEALESCKV